MTRYSGLDARRWPAALVMALMTTSASLALAQAPWPQVTIPTGVTTGLASQMTANGLPVRVQRFRSTAAPANVAALFRQSLGKPLVEDKIGTKLVLGRAQGEHYLTVQLEAAGTGTRGLIAVAEMTAALNGLAASRDGDQRLLARLAAGFNIVSRTASEDTRRRVEQIVFTNTHSIGVNTASIKSMLQRDGFTFERETPSTVQTSTREASLLFFTKPGGDAVAVISRDDSGKSAVVLNTSSYLEHAR